MCRNFDFKMKRDHGKMSYEGRIYESVDDKSLSWDLSQKSSENGIHAEKG